MDEMGEQPFLPKAANFRLCNVSSYTTELLEIPSEDPMLHVLFIPGNPGVVTFYKDFLESLYGLLGGRASVTAIGHISQSRRDYEKGRLFTLQEQIDHKVNFIRQEMKDTETPIALVGHSIGSYISIKVFQRYHEKVIYCVNLYPFLKSDPSSFKQSVIKKLAGSSIARAAVSFIVASLGLLPSRATELIVAKSIGNSWSRTAIEATCSHLLKYHTMQNILFMAKTEFDKLSEEPDWAFLKTYQSRIAFLFGIDDHWGPLHMFEEISRQVPDITLSIENEGHTHSFCCTVAGSTWVAQHAVSLIKDNIFHSDQRKLMKGQ